MYYHRQEFLKIVYHMHDKLAIIKQYLLFRFSFYWSIRTST